jgi:hypothetical protein
MQFPHTKKIKEFLLGGMRPVLDHCGLSLAFRFLSLQQIFQLAIRQTNSFIENSIEAGKLLGGKHKACLVLGVAGIEPMPS